MSVRNHAERYPRGRTMNSVKLNLASGDVINVERGWEKESSNPSPLSASAALRAAESKCLSPKYRIFILYPDETIKSEIPLDDIKTGGTYSENYQDGQRRSLSFSLNDDAGKYLVGVNNFWVGTRLRLDLGVENELGELYWFEKGIFVITKATCSEDSSGAKSTNITAGDKFALFEGKMGTIGDTLEIPVGSLIEDVIKNILAMDAGNGYPYDSRSIVYHSSFSGKRTQTAISKTSGETYGSVLLELATQLSAEVFYNSQGNLTFVPTSETTGDGDKPLLINAVSEDGDIDSLGFDFDFTSIVNRMIVTGASNSSSAGVYKAVAVNDDPKSPLCYQRIGYRTGSVINDPNISSQQLAKERASYELRKVSILKSSVSLNVAFNPLITVNNLMTVTDSHYGIVKKRFLIQSLSCSFDYSGTMAVSASSLDNIPFLTR